MENMILGGMIALMGALLEVPAVQAQFVYMTNGGEITIRAYVGPGGAVIISNNISGLPVTSIAEWAFAGCSNLTSVTIPGSVADIGDYAFESCVSLTNATIANGVTSIGEGAFCDCSSLTNVMIPASVTDIGSVAFGAAPNMGGPGVSGGCSSLTAINVDSQNSFYSSINGVLYDKSGSTLVQYPGGIAGSYTIPGTVTTLWAGAFCGTLVNSLTIPGTITNFGGYAVAYCPSLTNATIANGVPSIGSFAFNGCSNLTIITIPASVTSIGDLAYYDCIRLTSVYFDGSAPTLGDAVFVPGPVTFYYLPGTTGWSNSFDGWPAVLWNPLIQTGDGSFGVRNGLFGFNITGTTNIPIVVQACTNLAGPVWTPLQSLALTNGAYYFSEPFQPGTAPRFYRISSQ